MLSSVRPWESLRQHEKAEFFIVLDDMDKAVLDRLRLPSYVQVIQVPKTFKSVQAKYKARALEYFRQSQQLTDQDWILHLDEESKIDHAVIQSCVDFIERGHEDIGMVSWYSSCYQLFRATRRPIVAFTDIDIIREPSSTTT